MTNIPTHINPIRSVGTDIYITTKIFGGLLGVEYIALLRDSTGAKAHYRFGDPALSALRRGVPLEELFLMEVDENGGPIDE